MIFVSCAVSKLVSEDLKKAFALYPAAAEHLATQECDVILVSGALLFAHVGYEHALETFQKIRETVKRPVVVDLEAQFDALRAVGANKIVISAPYEAARTEERRRLCESVGFKVLKTKSLGLTRRWEIQQQSPYVTYRQAKEAFFEAPKDITHAHYLYSRHLTFLLYGNLLGDSLPYLIHVYTNPKSTDGGIGLCLTSTICTCILAIIKSGRCHCRSSLRLGLYLSASEFT